jgi:hypothetical protein
MKTSAGKSEHFLNIEGDAKKNQGAVFHDYTLIFNDFAGRDDWI